MCAHLGPHLTVTPLEQFIRRAPGGTLVLFRLISLLACLKAGKGQGGRRAASARARPAPPPPRDADMYIAAAQHGSFSVHPVVQPVTNAVECRVLGCGAWFPVGFPFSARPPPALCPPSHVLWSPRTQHDYSIIFSRFRSIHSSQLPINAQRSRTKFGFGRPLRSTAITNQIWLRKAVTFHAAEPDWAGQIGARLGPDWG